MAFFQGLVVDLFCLLDAVGYDLICQYRWIGDTLQQLPPSGQGQIHCALAIKIYQIE